jgi:hypothetical protein
LSRCALERSGIVGVLQEFIDMSPDMLGKGPDLANGNRTSVIKAMGVDVRHDSFRK